MPHIDKQWLHLGRATLRLGIVKWNINESYLSNRRKLPPNNKTTRFFPGKFNRKTWSMRTEVVRRPRIIITYSKCEVRFCMCGITKVDVVVLERLRDSNSSCLQSVLSNGCFRLLEIIGLSNLGSYCLWCMLWRFGLIGWWFEFLFMKCNLYIASCIIQLLRNIIWYLSIFLHCTYN